MCTGLRFLTEGGELLKSRVFRQSFHKDRFKTIRIVTSSVKHVFMPTRSVTTD